MHFKALLVTLLAFVLPNNASAFLGVPDPIINENANLKFNSSMDVPAPSLASVLAYIRAAKVASSKAIESVKSEERKLKRQFMIELYRLNRDKERCFKTDEACYQDKDARIAALTQKNTHEASAMNMKVKDTLSEEIQKAQLHALHIGMNAFKQTLVTLQKQNVISSVEMHYDENLLSTMFSSYNNKPSSYDKVISYTDLGKRTMPCLTIPLFVRFQSATGPISKNIYIYSNIRTFEEIEERLQYISAYSLIGTTVYGTGLDQLKNLILKPEYQVNQEKLLSYINGYVVYGAYGLNAVM